MFVEYYKQKHNALPHRHYRTVSIQTVQLSPDKHQPLKKKSVRNRDGLELNGTCQFLVHAKFRLLRDTTKFTTR